VIPTMDAKDLIEICLAGVHPRRALDYYLSEMGAPVRDIEGTKLDSGGRGKKFEKVLIKAFDIVGLKYKENRATGALWDIQTVGSGWERLVSDKEVNIKVSGTRWMFGGAEFGRMLPWDEIEDIKTFDPEKAAKTVRRAILKRNVHTAVFLAPKTRDTETEIESAVVKNDKKALVNLLTKENFKVNRLGSSFGVRVSVRDGKIGSIVIEKEGKVWCRSERPREIAGSLQVAFRAPKDALKRVPKSNVKQK